MNQPGLAAPAVAEQIDLLIPDTGDAASDSGNGEGCAKIVGVSFKPIPNVVIKSDYRNLDSKGGDLPDEFNLGIGFVF